MSTTLIINGAIRTEEGWINRGYLSIQSGKIADFGPGAPPEKVSTAALEIIDATNCAVLPGLINAHTHLSQTFMRGLSRGRPLMDWLQQVIWPLQNAITPEELYLASVLGLVENLRYGVTEVTNHHKIIKSQAHTEAVLKAAHEVGIRFTLARAWSDLGRSAEDPHLILDDLSHLFTTTAKDDRLNIANGPLALWRCSAKTLVETHNMALQNGSFTHFHVSESQQEVGISLEAYGQRPVAWLDSIGVLDAQTQVVHAVWVDQEEIQFLKARRATVIHCPVSNAVLGSGVAPLAAMLQQQIPILFGTDGAASNDSQDIWETLKFAVCMARAVELDPTILPPEEALSLALGKRSLAIGSPADLMIVDLNQPRGAPVIDYDSALVLGSSSREVQTVFVGGEALLKNGVLTILDENLLLAECRQAIKALQKRAGFH